MLIPVVKFKPFHLLICLHILVYVEVYIYERITSERVSLVFTYQTNDNIVGRKLILRQDLHSEQS